MVGKAIFTEETINGIVNIDSETAINTEVLEVLTSFEYMLFFLVINKKV